MTIKSVKELLNLYKQKVDSELQKDLYVFYIFLALTGELTFDLREMLQINSSFRGNLQDQEGATSIEESKAFYHYIKILKNSNLTNYLKYVKDCAKKKNIYHLYQENAEIIILQTCNKKNLAKFEKCEKYSEQINSIASDLENGKSDESSEDLSIIEFNSFEIKKRISKFIRKYPNMSKVSRLISNNIENVTLKPYDLLPNGIINAKLLRKYDKPLYKIVKDNQCLDELTSFDLEEYEYNLMRIDIEFNGTSLSTIRRNGGENGPTRRPDVKVSKNYQHAYAYDWEFIFCEISYGPYSYDELHYLEDKVRLGKFGKDSWNNCYLYTQSFENSDKLVPLMDEINLLLIHFYRTKMDIYVLDYSLKPFHKMCLIKSLDIPITNDDDLTIQKMNVLCKEILLLNNLITHNTQKIDRINTLINDLIPNVVIPSQNPPVTKNIFPTFSSPNSNKVGNYL
ncbi:unnamed protein product [Rhizophagus irregularis]|nr:unnamed protein product [Rhizophagus irregularis]